MSSPPERQSSLPAGSSPLSEPPADDEVLAGSPPVFVSRHPEREDADRVSSSPVMINSSPTAQQMGNDIDRNMNSSPLHPGSSPGLPGSSPGLPGSSPLPMPSGMSSSPGPMYPSSLLSSDIGNSNRRGGFSRRGDIPSDTRLFMSSEANTPMNLGSALGSALDSDIAGAPTRVIWGTNVAIQETMDRFRRFLQDFTLKDRLLYDGLDVPAGEGDVPIYMNMLQEMRRFETSNLNLDARNLLAYSQTRKLYYQLIDFPQEVIPIMDQTIKDILVSIVSNDPAGANSQELDSIETRIFKVRPYGLESKIGLRELNPSDIDKLVTIKGLVLRANDILPDMKEAFFRCAVCNHTIVVEVDRGTIIEPTRCPRKVCAQINSMQLVHNRSDFNDKQIIRLQETPDVIPDGQTPHSVSIIVYDELVDYSKAGDRVQVTGIYRSVPVRVNPVQRTLKNLFKTYVDVVHVQKVDTKRLGADPSTALESQINETQVSQQSNLEELRVLSDEDIAKIREVASRPDVYELLARSVAPSIYEQDDVKKGILLQLFGGTNKTFEKGGSPRYRGDINILLCGDPSTSKSQILQYIHKIAPRGMYTSGKGSSAVGLTAYVTRDQESKQIVLESGALVLSDGGICCIDEFDKMSDATRSVLHEVMEQQTVSIAKAGIITTLNARTSILASANPINSQYNPRLSVPQNIDLPPTLLSRFDLVYLMIDKIDFHSDKRLADHLTAMYLEDRPENGSSNEVLPTEFLTMYISYAKQNYNPVITLEAKNRMVKEYVSMRKLGEDARASEKRITATTRQLESIIRLSEARAKLRLSEEVLESDVVEAVRLIRGAIKDYATDPLTGLIDMDLVQTGMSSAQRRLQETHMEEIMGILDQQAIPMPERELMRRFNELHGPNEVDRTDFQAALGLLIDEGRVDSTGTTGQRSLRSAPQ